MKILHVIQTSGPGGAEGMLINLLGALSNYATKYSHVAALLKPGWLYQKLKDEGTDIRILDSGKSYDFKLIRSLLSLIKKERINLVHSHLCDTNFYASVAAKIAGIPHIATEHGDIHHQGKEWSHLRIKYWVLSLLSDYIVSVSEYTRNKLLEKMPWASPKYRIIYNGIPMDGFDSKDPQLRADLGLQNDDIVIGNVANLYPVKGQSYLIQAMKEVVSEYPEARLLIVGRGEMEHRLKQQVRQLGLEKHIKFLGFRKDVPDLLKLMDIFVLSSITEGFPLSLVEAMATGLPVVATDVGGIREVYELGADIRLTKTEDSHSSAQAIKELIRERNFKSQRNHELARRYFSVENMVKNYVALYDSLLPTTQ